VEKGVKKSVWIPQSCIAYLGKRFCWSCTH
jgi:hypothetical protein